MDIVYPCSLCTQTFTLRSLFLKHVKTVHESNTSSVNTDDSISLVSCTQCFGQFSSKYLLKKHIRLKHNSSTQNLKTTFTLKSEEKSVSQEHIDYLLDFLPENYTYKILAFKDLLFGKFKAKFQIIDADKEQFLEWLINLCYKSRVKYVMPSKYLKYGHRKIYRCKNIDYLNKEILQNPTKCEASLTVVIERLNKEIPHKSIATIIIKHYHRHPMNYSTPLELYPVISNVYTEIMSLLQNNASVSDALQIYKTKVIENQGKRHYLNLMDIKLDVEFVYDLYYMQIGMSKFTSIFTKRVESLMKSMSYYNANLGTESAAINLIENNVVVAIRTPFMKTVSTEIVSVCSTSFNSCKTWFMFGQNDMKTIMPVGVVIATDNNECMLKAGLNLWKQLGGMIKTVIVEFIDCDAFQLAFPNASVTVSKFHFILGVWKWLFDVGQMEDFDDKLKCFVELKKIVYSKKFSIDYCLGTDFALALTSKYPNFHKFMKDIFKIGFLSCFSAITNPCSTIFERKLIYNHTKSFSILQMFHFVFDEMELFYTDFSTDSLYQQQTILNGMENLEINGDNLTYCCLEDNNCSLYLVECDKRDTFFVDIDIGLCSCTVNNVGAPCIHQIFLDKNLNIEFINIKSINCSMDILFSSGFNINDEEAENIDRNEFDNTLSEFVNVNNKIRDQFINDPDYFKDSIQSFVSTLKNNLVSDESLFLACHSLKNTQNEH